MIGPWEPYRREATYTHIRHRQCGGNITDFPGLQRWVCDQCKVMWVYSLLATFLPEALEARFEGQPEGDFPDTRIAWIQEADKSWHLGEITQGHGHDEGVLTDGRKWRRWQWV